MAAWYERFFDGLYSRVLPKQFDKAVTLRQARIVKRLLKVRKGHRVLDIPCGVGRLTIPMGKTGLLMTGVDLTAEYLRRASRDARRARAKAGFLCCDMRAIDFCGEFDAAFNWFGSFGYFSDAENLAFCQRVLRALRPGGRFLVEGINKTWLLTHFRPETELQAGGVSVAMHNRWDKRTNRVCSTWTFRRGKTRERHTVDMRVFNGAEIRALLRSAGFRDVKLYQNPPDRPFSRHARRWIAVARKPGQ